MSLVELSGLLARFLTEWQAAPVTSASLKGTTLSSNETNSEPAIKPEWQVLTRNQRRVLGVLIEKSKTTPDGYPMSINALKNGANQKTNRSPILDLDESQVEDTLYELRHFGAVIEIHSGGRVPKYKHQAYDWFGVDKPELGVLAELLLRGEQSVGDLRARVARMETSITGLDELRPILISLKAKNLIVELTPAGRGQIVTHNVFQPNELAQLRQQFDSGADDDDGEQDENEDDVVEASTMASRPSVSETRNSSPTAVIDVAKPTNATSPNELASLQQRVESLEAIVTSLQADIAEIQKLLE